jgi:hypothetical protein
MSGAAGRRNGGMRRGGGIWTRRRVWRGRSESCRQTRGALA